MNRKPRKTLSFNQYELEKLRYAISQSYGVDNYLFDKIDEAMRDVIMKTKLILEKKMKRHEIIKYLEKFVYPVGTSASSSIQYTDDMGVIRVFDLKSAQIAFEKLVAKRD